MPSENLRVKVFVELTYAIKSRVESLYSTPLVDNNINYAHMQTQIHLVSAARKIC